MPPRGGKSKAGESTAAPASQADPKAFQTRSAKAGLQVLFVSVELDLFGLKFTSSTMATNTHLHLF